MKFEINMELVLSTCYIPVELARIMDRGEEFDPPVAYHTAPYGYRIYVREPLEDYPEEMRPLINLALTLHCKWLLLDADGPDDVNLMKWDW